ncbi:MAG: hypothetical protein Q7V05_07605 [Methanoregula sp.]|nr:hypothetical protein [Methanoregula sp.]
MAVYRVTGNYKDTRNNSEKQRAALKSKPEPSPASTTTAWVECSSMHISPVIPYTAGDTTITRSRSPINRPVKGRGHHYFLHHWAQLWAVNKKQRGRYLL